MDNQSGITPFEEAAAKRAKLARHLTTGYATNQLIIVLDECNIMIKEWEVAASRYAAHPTEDNKIEMDVSLALATEALKEKKSAEEALLKVAEAAIAIGITE